jgi:hypothetical protein
VKMDESPKTPPQDRRYVRAARLLAQKLGMDWHKLPPEQVLDYARKLDIAADKDKGRRSKDPD